MSKKIKYYFVKRSITWLTIFSLLVVSTGFGLVFDFSLTSILPPKVKITLEAEPAVAQDDTATTTVEVRNAPPVFDGNPVENPISSSTSPINVGDTIAFVATATDVELNNYKLLICSSDSVVPDVSGGEGHACGATTFASSSFVAQGTQATAYYDVVDPGAEFDDWWAFVCDNHATQADCVASGNQGSGDSGSPFYVNHAPSFTAIATTDNNKDPGDTYTITANVTDSDTAGGADILHLYICSSNSWSVSSGCAGLEYCHATSTSPDIVCDTFATGTVAVDGDWDYFAFVKDWHDMAAPQNSRSSTYRVNNVSPEVTDVVLNWGLDITLAMKGMDETVVVASSSSVTDANSCMDLVDATSTIYWSSATGGNDCTADDNDCYQIGLASCLVDMSTCSGISDDTATVVCSTTLAYHAIPTDISTGNPYSGTNWLAAITARDEALSSTTVSVSGVEMETLTALDIDEDLISYGTVRGGDDTGAYNATTTVINFGNAPLDAEVDVTDMEDSPPVNTIEAENQYYATSTFTYGSGYTHFMTEADAPFQLDINNPRPTSPADVEAPIYWGIAIPAGRPSGTYTGLNTFYAALDENGVGW